MMDRFNLKKLNFLELKEQYQLKISKTLYEMLQYPSAHPIPIIFDHLKALCLSVL